MNTNPVVIEATAGNANERMTLCSSRAMKVSSLLSDRVASRDILIRLHSYRSLEDLSALRNSVKRLAELLTNARIWRLAPEHSAAILQPDNASKVVDRLRDILKPPAKD